MYSVLGGFLWQISVRIILLYRRWPEFLTTPIHFVFEYFLMYVMGFFVMFDSFMCFIFRMYMISISLFRYNYIHLDIKFENIIISKTRPIKIKIIDLAFCKKLDQKNHLSDCTPNFQLMHMMLLLANNDEHLVTIKEQKHSYYL